MDYNLLWDSQTVYLQFGRTWQRQCCTTSIR